MASNSFVGVRPGERARLWPWDRGAVSADGLRCGSRAAMRAVHAPDQGRPSISTPRRARAPFSASLALWAGIASAFFGVGHDLAGGFVAAQAQPKDISFPLSLCVASPVEPVPVFSQPAASCRACRALPLPGATESAARYLRPPPAFCCGAWRGGRGQCHFSPCVDARRVAMSTRRAPNGLLCAQSPPAAFACHLFYTLSPPRALLQGGCPAVQSRA